MKKLLSVFLALVLVLGCAYFVPNFTAHAASSGTCGDGLTWTLDNNGTLTISGSGDMPDWTPSNPSPWSKNNDIVNVVVLDGVTSIGTYAFQYCDSFESISVSKSVSKIGVNAFLDCLVHNAIYVDSSNPYFYSSATGVLYNKDRTVLVRYPQGRSAELSTSFVVPSTVKHIEESAVRNCQNLITITLPTGLETIGPEAFRHCINLESINIPNGVENIENMTFLECFSLQSIDIPGSVASIGESAFDTCSRLSSLHISYGVQSIGVSAFDMCPSLACDVIIPGSVTSIGNRAFRDCLSITSLTISYGVKSIGDSAFNECNKISSIEIPESVESIGKDAFYPCSGLTEIKILNKNCTIYQTSTTIPTKAAIWGYEGSTAQSYANRYRKKFHILAESILSLPESIILEKDESNTFVVEVLPETAEIKDLVWTSSAPNIVAVDQNGNVTAVEFGTATITATSANNSTVKASCEVTVQRNITRLFGTSRYDTAIAISDEGWTSAGTVVLANGTNYADALAGVPLAYKLNAPILLTAGKSQLESGVAAQIEKLGATKVILLGGTFAISADIENELAQNYTVERVFGATRYDTALEISKKVNPNPTTVFIVTGTGYADALSVSPYAAMKGYPIVYSNPNTGLTASTVEYLASTRKIFVIGGIGAVGQNTIDQIEDKSIERIFGVTRYLTSYEIANRFADEFGDAVMFATGTNFPDALAGGVLGAKIGAPLLLTHPNGAIDEIKNFVLDKNPRDVYILGGTGAVPDSVVNEIFE
ncbi:MAG: leucine-rich repeat protein [Clostridia bacterium]|nr:leucine-rich repeat protein [Clostridia bacterium]